MSFGSGLGAVIGGSMAANDLENAQSSINGTVSNFQQGTQPYNNFGQSFINPATSAITGLNDTAHNVKSYDDFMSSYTNTPAAQYQLQQADAVQDNSAAAKGGLLSGANERALGTINSGIVAQNANTAYNEYLSGNNQQFGQLTQALGGMFSAIGVGTTATGQQGALDAAQLGATANIAKEQASNDQKTGAGFGSMFDGIPFFGF